MKRIIKRAAVIFAVLLLCFLITLPVFASQPIFLETRYHDDFSYTVNCSDHKFVEVLSVNEDVVDLVFPDDIKGCQVVRFNGNAFRDCIKLESVTFPAYAELDDINLKYCPKLKSVKISSNNENYSCKDFVLYNKDKTELIKLLKDYDGTFNIRGGVTTIREAAFKNNSVSRVIIPRSVESIGASCFMDCVRLEGVEFNCAITELSDKTFKGCRSLKEIRVPSTVVSVGEDVFDGCLNLVSLTLPGGLKEIKGPLLGTYEHCPRLKRIRLTKGEGNYSLVDGVLFNKDMTELVAFMPMRTGSYSIPNSVTSIADSAFAESSIEKVTFGSNVSKIGNRAFYNADNLKKADLPESIASIGEETFWGCKALKKMHISANVSSINYNSFYNCSSMDMSVDSENGNYFFENGCLYERSTRDLMYCSPSATSCNIYTKVSNNWFFAFEDAKNLESITAIEGAEVVSVDGVLYNETLSALFYIPHAKVQYTLPSTVETISSAAIKGFPKNLDLSVSANNKYYRIENGVLFRKYSTGSILVRYPVLGTGEIYELPNWCDKIGEYAFAGCKQLENIDLHDKVETIGAGAFDGCDNLKFLRIPSECTLLLSSTGGGNSQIYYIHYISTNTSRDPYVIERMLGTGCDGLERIVFSTPNRVDDFDSIRHDRRDIPVLQCHSSSHKLNKNGVCFKCDNSFRAHVEFAAIVVVFIIVLCVLCNKAVRNVLRKKALR